MFERCLYFNTNALSRKLNGVWDSAFAECGLSAPLAYLVRLVAQQPGITQRLAGEVLRLEKSTITRFVNSLIEKGLVQRRIGEDGRENRLYLTAKGRRVAPRLEEIGNRLYQTMTSVLGKQTVKELVGMMREAGGAL